MRIERIDLQNIVVSPHSGAHVATVLLHSDTASLSLCASVMPASTTPASNRDDVLTRALVQDALRQVRRMPEYRTGAKVVTVADTAWPVGAEQA